MLRKNYIGINLCSDPRDVFNYSRSQRSKWTCDLSPVRGTQIMGEKIWDEKHG